ncbi:dethiobiotin synthase [Azospirillum isscasi]|uniref:ATP-dependent dethiobiotin synthetase BioD n=1 Tax=Azospirillum isscasi TaxID=3053926 RepID=A0ABU0WRK3_9PROT|nr:dethiobiotin synthase [Azospirillum isscasi]MDQ2105429.1 dethiobiotin synthase [Azospirillum isscasi]
MTLDPRKAAIAAAFGKAALRYEDHAAVQRVAAERLAERVAHLPLPPRPRVLEIGCGTGFLSRALRGRIGPADWLLTDLSPDMLARCRAALGDPTDSEFRILDGETPDLDGPFDLIVSSLALQWFRDPAAALARWAGLLAPGGRIAFATLAADSFREWREAHHALGLEAGVPAYPTRHDLDRLWPGGGAGTVEEDRLLRRHADGLEFLAELKGIGAHLPAEGRRPLPPGALRRVLRRLARPEGLTMTHHIAYGLFRKDGAKPRGVFVTGTDTGVGKTLVSACLVRAWDAAYWKPLQTGLKDEPGDTPTVAGLAALPAERVHPPAYALAEPLSPLAAADLEGVAIDPGALALPDTGRPLVVEGAGGLMVPVTGDVFIIDLIARFGLPVVLVARSTLGTINHTLLSLEALRARGLAVAGVVLNGPPNPGNRAAIERFGKVPVLAEIPTLSHIDAASVAEAAALIPSFDRVFP